MTAPAKDHAKSPRQAALETLFARIGEVSALPAVAQRIIKLAEDESTGADDLLGAMEGDIALATKILRRVNSSYYGMRNKVADLRTAISLLGFREIRTLALTVFVSRMFRQSGNHRGYSRQGLWDHLSSTAVTARLVAEVSQRGDPDAAYVGGLLHDIGFVLLDQHLHKHFCAVIDELDEDTPTEDVERKLYSFDHAQLGSYVVAQWNFPEQISSAIEFHHHPQRYEGPHRDLVFAVATANFLCSRAGFSSLGVHNVASPVSSVYAGLGLDEAKLSDIWNRLPPLLEATDTMLSV